MSYSQITGFTNGSTYLPLTEMSNNSVTLPLYSGFAIGNYTTLYFESNTSSTTPYSISIRKDGVEVANSGSITSGALFTTNVAYDELNDTSGYTAYIESDSNITFQLLRFGITQYQQQNFLAEGMIWPAYYTSTDLSYTPNGSTEVSSTGNYRQQTIGNLGTVTACASCGALPTIVTTSITNITGTTATGGGESITDGGGTVSQKGIQWSANNFATQMGASAEGAGTASFASSIIGLTAGDTYYVRAFVVNEFGTGFGAIIQFTSIVTIPCNSSVSAGGSGIQDIGVGLDSTGGIIAFLVYGANYYPDKFEIFHGATDATYGVTIVANKVATSSYGTTVSNFGPFEDEYGTSDSNPLPPNPGSSSTGIPNPNGGVFPSESDANGEDQFIDSSVFPPTRQTEFNNATGYTVPSMQVPSGTGTTYQQIIWWEYGPGHYNTSTTAILRVTAPWDVATSWEVLRLCCPDSNCTAPPT